MRAVHAAQHSAAQRQRTLDGVGICLIEVLPLLKRYIHYTRARSTEGHVD